MHGTKIRLFVILAVITAIVGCNAHEMVVSMTREEIQARVAPSFPLTKSWFVVTVVLSEPEVFLVEEANQIGIAMRVEVTIPFLKPISGHLRAAAVPHYNAQSKSFYLEDATIEQLDLPGLMPELQAKARTAIETIARQELAKRPLYELKGRNLKEIAAGFTLREIQVRDGRLEAIFSLPI